MLKQPKTYVESLVVSAVSTALDSLGNTWQEVATSLQEDHEINFDDWKRDQPFLADDNPLADWAREYFPRLDLCCDEQGFIGYLPDSDEEIVVQHTPASAIFMHKWIHDELYE